MKYFMIAALLLITACAEKAWTSGNNQPKYAYVGCHIVELTPSSDGSVAIGPFGVKTEIIYFKQYNLDGTISPITTGKPC